MKLILKIVGAFLLIVVLAGAGFLRLGIDHGHARPCSHVCPPLDQLSDPVSAGR